MRVIWKQVVQEAPVMLPNGFAILKLGLDPQDQPAIWFTCDPQEPMKRWRFVEVGTGWVAPDAAIYLGTHVDGLIVVHTFLVMQP